MPIMIGIFIFGLIQLHFLDKKEHKEGETKHQPLKKDHEFLDAVSRYIRG